MNAKIATIKTTMQTLTYDDDEPTLINCYAGTFAENYDLMIE